MMSSIALACRAVVGACVLFLAAQPAIAQSDEITGVVRDPQQAVVTGAEVVLINSRTTARATALTDGQGRYSFATAPSIYILEVHAKGSQVSTSEAITLGAGETATRDFVLALAGTT